MRWRYPESIRDMLALPKPLKAMGTMIGVGLTVIGVGGLGDDISTWGKWLKWVGALDGDIWRWIVVLVGLTLIAAGVLTRPRKPPPSVTMTGTGIEAADGVVVHARVSPKSVGATADVPTPGVRGDSHGAEPRIPSGPVGKMMDDLAAPIRGATQEMLTSAMIGPRVCDRLRDLLVEGEGLLQRPDGLGGLAESLTRGSPLSAAAVDLWESEVVIALRVLGERQVAQFRSKPPTSKMSQALAAADGSRFRQHHNRLEDLLAKLAQIIERHC